ncbi:MAG: hypothetical protein WD904_10700 [Dehalococcoidia bacterium]
MRKFVIAAVAAFGIFFVAGGGNALAAHCFVVSKTVGAGEQGVFFNLSAVGGPNVDVFDLKCNPGNGIVCEEVAPGIFVGSTPAGAHNSGPGDSECDGVGIDDLFDCE